MTTPSLTELLARRERAHRVDGASLPMTSVADLAAWLEERRLACVSARSSLANAAEAIVGRPIQGSWWADPDSALIYQLLGELTDIRLDYLDLVLVGSRRTLVHPDLVPLVKSIAAEPGRRQRAMEALPAAARRLLSSLGAGGADASTTTGDRSARVVLEAALLVRSESHHTDAGRHVSTLEWLGEHPEPAPAGYQNALARLLEAALRSAVIAPQKEVVDWFRSVEPDAKRRADAVGSLACLSLTDGRAVWLAPQ